MVYVPEGLSLRQDGLSGQSSQEWSLDTPDNAATVNTDGYISDAQRRGIRVGDRVHHRQWTTFTDQYTKTGPILSETIMTVISLSSANDSCDLSDGLTIPQTDTD